MLLSSRCVVVGAHLVVERVEERERFDLGGIDALADNELGFGGAAQAYPEGAASVVRSSLRAGQFDLFGDELFAVAGLTSALDDFAFQDGEVTIWCYRALGFVGVAGDLPYGETRRLIDIDWNARKFDSFCTERVCACVEVIAGLRGTSVAQCETCHNSDDLAVNGAIQPYQQAAYEALTLVVCNCCTPIKSIVGLLVSKVASDWGEAKAPRGWVPNREQRGGVVREYPLQTTISIKIFFSENFQNFYNIFGLVSNNFSLVYIIICIIIW